MVSSDDGSQRRAYQVAGIQFVIAVSLIAISTVVNLTLGWRLAGLVGATMFLALGIVQIRMARRSPSTGDHKEEIEGSWLWRFRP
jgi:hypothetical protein